MKHPEITPINAGSMADIAFLLLIFFLVTTTLDKEQGFSRKLPPKSTEISTPIIRRNLFIVNISDNDKILINNNKLIIIENLKNEVKLFLDNGGGFDKNKLPCSYCQGNQSSNYSVHPNKAVISLESS